MPAGPRLRRQPIVPGAALFRQPAFADRAHVDLGISIRRNAVTPPHRDGDDAYQPHDERELKPYHRCWSSRSRRFTVITVSTIIGAVPYPMLGAAALR